MKKEIRKKTLFQSVIYIFLLLTLVFLYAFFAAEKNNIWYLGLAMFWSVLLVVSYHYYRNEKKLKQSRPRNSMYRFFFYGIRVIIAITLLIGIIGTIAIFSKAESNELAIYHAIGLAIIIIWVCVFLAYFIWAIYYYNINNGISEEEWDKIHEALGKKKTGDFYSEDDLNTRPKENPYKDETFGLPSGTVRGMIAFTLLFGAIAMLIVSIGMKNEIPQHTVLWDQYEFFKKAFLMMIAFYFGSRSLKYLNGQKAINIPGDKTDVGATNKKDIISKISKLDKPAPDSSGQGISETKQTVSGKPVDPMSS